MQNNNNNNNAVTVIMDFVHCFLEEDTLHIHRSHLVFGYLWDKHY